MLDILLDYCVRLLCKRLKRVNINVEGGQKGAFCLKKLVKKHASRCLAGTTENSTYKFSCQRPERAYDALNTIYASRVRNVLSLQNNVGFCAKKLLRITQQDKHDKLEPLSSVRKFIK